MQKRSHKMQSLQDKKVSCSRKLVRARKRCQKLEEINEREARYLQLSNKSSNNWMAAEDLEGELRGVKAGEERRGSCASQANDCCLDAVAEQLFTMRAAHARQQLQAPHEKLFRRFEVPTAPAQMPGGEEKEESGKRRSQSSKPNGFTRRGFRVQMVKAVEQEISIHRTIEADLFPRSPRREQQQMQVDGIL